MQRWQLRGGAGSCVNQNVNGTPVDPISLQPIPLNRLLRLPVDHNNKASDYYCFDQNTLYEWLRENSTNPLTGIDISLEDARYISKNVKKWARDRRGFIQNWNSIYHPPPPGDDVFAALAAIMNGQQ
jgi:hypothetical protein